MTHERQTIDVNLHIHGLPTEERRLERLIVQAFDQLRSEIMSALSDWAARQKSSLDAISKSVDGLVDDVKALNDKITELQNSPGKITPEDQALLDDLQSQGQSLASRMATLDAQTPPPSPPPAG